MTPPADPARYKNHLIPGAIISHGVWLSSRFTLRYRDVQELLFERGITVSQEAVRQWCRKFGQDAANRLRRRRPQPGDTWHLDEVFLTIHGERHDLWRAVDQHDNVLDILVQRRRNKQAAKKFFRKWLKGCQYVPRVIITDKLKSDSAAKRESLPGVEHRQSRYLNNRCENSHRPTRPTTGGRFRDPVVDQLFERQKVGRDEPERAQRVRELQKEVIKKAWWIPGLWWTRLEVRSARIHNYEPMPSHWMNRRLEDVWLSAK